MMRCVLPGTETAVPRSPQMRRLWLVALLVLIAGGLAGPLPPAPAEAAGPALPPYVYVTVSGPASYDVMRVVGGKESRLSRVGMAGVGFGDVAARMASDGAHTAIRVSGDRTGG